jgi:hypothetical protein
MINDANKLQQRSQRWVWLIRVRSRFQAVGDRGLAISDLEKAMLGCRKMGVMMINWIKWVAAASLICVYRASKVHIYLTESEHVALKRVL